MKAAVQTEEFATATTISPPASDPSTPGRSNPVRSAGRLGLGAVLMCLPVCQLATLGYLVELTGNVADSGRRRGMLPAWSRGGRLRHVLGLGLIALGFLAVASGSGGVLEAPADPGAATLGGIVALLGTLTLAWAHFKRGVSYFLATGLLFLPGSALIAINWEAGFVYSFDRVDEYLARGPLLVMLGGLMVMAAAAYAPMAWVHACRTGRPTDVFAFSTVWDLVRRRPLAYAALFAVGALLAFPLQLGRAVQLESVGGAIFVSCVYLLSVYGLKTAWAKSYLKALRRPGAAAWGWRALASAPIFGFAFVYFFRMLFFQFFLWHGHPGGHWEWFSHWLYLLPSPIWSF